MLRSDGRILTTHAGSLPRPPALLKLHVARSKHEAVDPAALAREIETATLWAVRKQVECGIDVGNNGEQPHESFMTYVQDRLSGYRDHVTGLGGLSDRPIMRDVAFPTFLRIKIRDWTEESVSLVNAPKAIGEVKHVTLEPLREECDGFDRLRVEAGSPFAEPFMAAASPGIITAGMLNAFYPDHRSYVFDVAEAMRPEYEHIVSRGYVLQLDCPDLAMERHMSYADRSLDDFKDYVRTNVEAINHAIAGLPRDRIRLHACWGNYEGPHHLDVPVEEILPLLYEANVGALVLPFANPRHQHEWRVIQRHPLPKDWLLVAGVIDTTTNYVEHPEVVSDRLENVARVVGDPARVLAGTDCGFGTAAGFGEVAEEVVWLKLKALRDGAEIASQRLFS